MIISAHWDTVEDSPGVDDNGSGVVAVLEVARIISGIKNNSNTVIFALFDKEEVGCEGSKVFIRELLVPLFVKKFGSKIQVYFHS